MEEPDVTVTSATNYAKIKFGQKYSCNQTWLNNDATSDPNAPGDGFFFKNKDTPAAAVVAKKINGKTTPYYISPVLLPPGGRLGDSKLIPTPTVAVWCQMDVDNGTMIESDKSDLYIIELQGTTAKATFYEDGYGALARTSMIEKAKSEGEANSWIGEDHFDLVESGMTDLSLD
ncbi:MAG: hypothetical protein Q9199_006413 [Rusavskia elegans]